MDEPRPVEQDSRGILDPWLLRRRAVLTRYPSGQELAGLVDRFWAVRWELPAAVVHRQSVLTHPGANISVGHGDADRPDYAPERVEACCYGVATGLTTRAMADAGWTVAAMTTPGGLGAFLTGSAADMTGRVVPLGRVFAVDEPELVGQLCRTESEAARVDVLRAALVAAVRPERAEQARTVAATAALMETDRGLRCLGELAERSGIGTRTLQRLFHEYAGVSPTWVLRRYRLLDVAEAVRTGRRVVWSEVATELGYADQAHLIRDFRAATGGTPAAYQAAIARSRPD